MKKLAPQWAAMREINKTKVSIKYWRNLKNGAAVRGHDFSITREFAQQLIETQSFKCALSGLEISLAETTKEAGTASLDRINSALAYTPDNVQWVHKDVNMMKQGLDQDRFLILCGRIAEHNKPGLATATRLRLVAG